MLSTLCLCTSRLERTAGCIRKGSFSPEPSTPDSRKPLVSSPGLPSFAAPVPFFTISLASCSLEAPCNALMPPYGDAFNLCVSPKVELPAICCRTSWVLALLLPMPADPCNVPEGACCPSNDLHSPLPLPGVPPAPAGDASRSLWRSRCDPKPPLMLNEFARCSAPSLRRRGAAAEAPEVPNGAPPFGALTSSMKVGGSQNLGACE